MSMEILTVLNADGCVLMFYVIISDYDISSPSHNPFEFSGYLFVTLEHCLCFTVFLFSGPDISERERVLVLFFKLLYTTT